MGIKNRISNAQSAQGRDFLYESFIKEERAYKADRLVEKWSRVKEVGKGIENMPVSTARNLAILLENQAAYMSKMTEAQLSNSFAGYSPENMLRLVRL